MSEEKFCVNGHVIDPGHEKCSRCGSGTTAPEVEQESTEEKVEEPKTENVDEKESTEEEKK